MKLTKNITIVGAITLVAVTFLFSSAQATQGLETVSLFKSKTVKPYKLKTCIVSEEELGSMGDTIRFVYKDQEIKVCCKPCIKKFKKDPKKYLKLLEEASKQSNK